MNKELIINVTPSEIAIALFEDKQLVELNKEKCKTGYSVGDIYLGKVKKIMPGLNAAFVNIGYEKDAFIHYLDLGPQFTSLHKLVGTLTSGRKLLCFKTYASTRRWARPARFRVSASGQPILAQIAKEAISTKGLRLTSDISLAGRNVVLIPFSNKISISQKIRSNEERNQSSGSPRPCCPRYGVIIRTAAMGQQDADIEHDITSLVRRWEKVLDGLRNQTPPSLILNEENRTTTIIRDLLNGSFSSIYVDDHTVYEEIREYIRMIAPDKEKIVKLYKGSTPIFDNFDVSKQIMSLFSKYVSLKKGAYLIIEHTEALHVVDVNSGNRAKVDNDQERTAMDVNLAAAAEIARQLRLRDMGGIIVIDFIDLHKSENRNALVEKMRELMAGDRAKHDPAAVEVRADTRSRASGTARRTSACGNLPACHGTGSSRPPC
ncbi:MAG: Rne/Rng family ribonuclease [Alistipes ihumii]